MDHGNIGKKRNRTVKRDEGLPAYASTKKSNQVNPICWVACSDEDSDTCSVYSVRKKIIECEDRVPLPSHIEISARHVHDLKERIEPHARRDENIVNAMVGKEAYRQAGYTGVIYDLLDPDDINALSIYTFFKDPVFSTTVYRFPTEIATVAMGDETFVHKERGSQFIHTWIHFKNDFNLLQHLQANVDLESLFIRSPYVVDRPYRMALKRHSLGRIMACLDTTDYRPVPSNLLRRGQETGKQLQWM